MNLPDNGSKADDEIVVFSIVREAVCAECGVELFKGNLLRMEQDKPHCLACADLDHLVFLPSGDTALTRRSRKHSALSAVVVRFSRSRGRYERQGLLVEPAALEKAETECAADAPARDRARAQAEAVRVKADDAYVREFAGRILAQYPHCSPTSADEIAAHTCQKYSGRVGRSADAKEFDAGAITLAVRAHIRHRHTNYDSLLNRGMDRTEARRVVAEKVGEVEARWR